jgi:hypothetical protein
MHTELLEHLKGRDHSEFCLVGNNIRMDVREIGWEGAEWICPALYRD